MELPKTDEAMKKILSDEVLFAMKILALYLDGHHVGAGDPREFGNFVDTAHRIAGKPCDWAGLDQPAPFASDQAAGLSENAQWSREVPNAEGYYWWKPDDPSKEPVICRFIEVQMLVNDKWTMVPRCVVTMEDEAVPDEENQESEEETWGGYFAPIVPPHLEITEK